MYYAMLNNPNFNRDHEHLVNIFKLLKKIKQNIALHEPKLALAHSNWHNMWIYSRDQIIDLCSTYHLLRPEVEINIINQKLNRQRRPIHSIEDALIAIDWVMQQIESEVPSARRIIYQRAEQQLQWKKIAKLNPGRFIPSMMDDYFKFLSRVAGCQQFEYLRRKT